MTDAAGPDGALLSGARGRRLAEERLRAELARGDVLPGQRLVEAELGERYGVTRSSARTALDALVADGLVERVPNRGARVRTVSADEAVAIMECRLVLDGLLARKAAESVTDEGVARLEANARRMAEALARQELTEYSALIQQHHALVSEIAGQHVAAALVERLQAQIVRHQYRLSLRPDRPRHSLAELQRVVAAIVARDGDAAETAAREHVRAVIGMLREPPTG
ncbi:GntR family transcriptional regulator [Modestobacter sp. SYSU DS0290]